MTRFPAVGGGDSKQPIASKDRAETFDESDVSVTHTNTSIERESIRFPIPTGGIVSRQADGSTSNGDGKYGVKIKANTDLQGLSLKISDDAGGVSVVSIYDTTDGSLVGETTGNFSAGDTVNIHGEMKAGEYYNAVGHAGGEDYTIGYSSSASFPITSTHLDIVNGAQGEVSSNSWPRNVNDITPLLADSESNITSGTAYVEWPDPPDVYRWDAASYQSSPDGETVEVYIEEDDGDGYTEIAGPIDPGKQIDALPDSQVRFRVELSRVDTSNSPTLDAIYRRWVVGP